MAAFQQDARRDRAGEGRRAAGAPRRVTDLSQGPRSGVIPDGVRPARPYAGEMTPAAVRERLRSRTVQLALAGRRRCSRVAASRSSPRRAADIRVSSRSSSPGTPEGGQAGRARHHALPARVDARAGGPARPRASAATRPTWTARRARSPSTATSSLAYTARGFGASGGLIHFDVAATTRCTTPSCSSTTWPACRRSNRSTGGRRSPPPVRPTAAALSLLLAAADHRDRRGGRRHHLERPRARPLPELRRHRPGRVQEAVGRRSCSATPSPRPRRGQARGRARSESASCGRFAPDVCAAYQASARGRRAERRDARADARRPARRPSSSKINAPTLLTQGEQDSLFPLSEADANARGIAAHGTPVRVVWRTGGHDTGGGAGRSSARRCVTGSTTSSAAGVTARSRSSSPSRARVVSAATGGARAADAAGRRLPGHRRYAAQQPRTVAVERARRRRSPRRRGGDAGGDHRHPRPRRHARAASTGARRWLPRARRARPPRSSRRSCTHGLLDRRRADRPAGRHRRVDAATRRCSPGCAISRPDGTSTLPAAARRAGAAHRADARRAADRHRALPSVVRNVAGRAPPRADRQHDRLRLRAAADAAHVHGRAGRGTAPLTVPTARRHGDQRPATRSRG